MSNWEAARRRNSSNSLRKCWRWRRGMLPRPQHRAPRHLKRVTEFDPKIPAAVIARRLQFEGKAVQACGSFEPESFGRLVRACRGIPCRFVGISGAVEVHGQHLRIGPRGCFECMRQPCVAVFEDQRSELGVYRFANAIVIGLDFLAASRRPSFNSRWPPRRAVITS